MQEKEGDTQRCSDLYHNPPVIIVGNAGEEAGKKG